MRALVPCLAVGGLWPVASASGQGGAVVTMTVEVGARQPISRYVYGLNLPEMNDVWGAGVPAGITMSRMGGNRLSAYNWETNASNCGNDCDGAFPNDGYLGGGDQPGEAVRTRAAWASSRGAAFLATVPMLGWVAGDKDGRVSMKDAPLVRRAARFKLSKARKGAPLSTSPDRSDGVVYQDEFVAFLERAFPGAKNNPATPIFYALDNEPDLWGSTHEVTRGDRLAPKKYVLTGYDELVSLGVEYGSAIKEVAPHALVFGPVLTNWNGFANLFHNDKPDPAGRRFFLEYYLERMRQAEAAQGRRVLDVLDVHWYSEAQSSGYQSVGNEWAEQDAAMVQARVQSTRSWWDPTYRERSWVSDVVREPIRLIPRLKELIARHYPGTKLAITEYFFHRGGDISGGLAQADALGILGREGVFAAAAWPQGSRWAYKGDLDKTYACAFAAFRSFLDFDGRGGRFGDTSLRATTSDVERTSLYASSDEANPSRLVLVALNKSSDAVEAVIQVQGGPSAGPVEAFRLTGGVGHCTGPVRADAGLSLSGGLLRATLPPFSVTTFVVPAPP